MQSWIHHQALHTEAYIQAETGSNTDRLEYRQHQSAVTGVLADLYDDQTPLLS